MTRVTLGSGVASAVIDPADGARLCSLDLGGGELLVPERDADAASGSRAAMWWGAFPMIPWTSLLRSPVADEDGVPRQMASAETDAAWHGVARSQAWTVTASSDATAELAVDLGEPWPFGGSATARFVLGQARLAVELAVRAGERSMPAAAGWHPWFVRELSGSPVELVLPDGVLVQERDRDGVPTGGWSPAEHGRTAWNDGIRTAWPAELRYPGIGTLAIAASSADAIVFSTDPQGICVEPATSPAEAMGHRLAPGSALALRITLGWIPLR